LRCGDRLPSIQADDQNTETGLQQRQLFCGRFSRDRLYQYFLPAKSNEHQPNVSPAGQTGHILTSALSL
jgi:hypothetical protein